ncbi:MAG TPA: ArgE/DapE family deacylase [Gemmatimonadaceae bacterium]|jgi:acetylornithine deacetylase
MAVASLARGDAVALTRELVRIDSRNPSLAAGAPGEQRVATALGDILRAWGFRVEMRDAAPGRPNVVARIGQPGRRALMFNGHLDVVGVDGMTHDPWNAPDRDGRIYGRGSTDMKSGVASMCAAATRAMDASGGSLDGEIVIAAVADEEFESLGTRALLDWGVRADAAIVTEPTRLAIMPAHKGFVWIEITMHGRAAHGSRWDIGVDAIRHAGLLLAEIDRMDSEDLPRREHALLGRPSIHASTIDGGIGMSTYPDRCTLRIERRTIPGETVDQVRGEIEAACAKLAAKHANFRADVRVTVAQGPSDVSVDAPIVVALSEALRANGEQVTIEGMSAWTDAALLNDAGIPAVLFGPGDISLAHAAEEWVSIDEIERATTVLARVATDWCTQRGTAWRS